jgi:hypothetical protein
MDKSSQAPTFDTTRASQVQISLYTYQAVWRRALFKLKVAQSIDKIKQCIALFLTTPHPAKMPSNFA